MQTNEVPKPVEPAQSPLPPESPGSSSVPQLLSAVTTHGLSTALAIYTAGKALAYLPDCLRMLVLPTGGISHDPWAWAPLVLTLSAVVAVASPVSFRSALDFVRVLRAPKP